MTTITKLPGENSYALENLTLGHLLAIRRVLGQDLATGTGTFIAELLAVLIAADLDHQDVASMQRRVQPKPDAPAALPKTIHPVLRAAERDGA